MDILITATDYRKLTQESKELLCASCEMAQLRCAKLINVRGKVRMNSNDLKCLKWTNETINQGEKMTKGWMNERINESVDKMKLLMNEKMNALMVIGTQTSDVYEESLTFPSISPVGLHV